MSTETVNTTGGVKDAPSTPKIYAAIAKANKAIGAIAKGSKNQQQGFMFRGIDDVYNELHAILADCEIFIVPEVVSYDVSDRQVRNGVVLFTRATIRHHFTTSDGSSVTTTVVGEAMDSGDKGMNKTMSIALKYALFQLFTIPTKEEKDPDAKCYELAQSPQTQTAPQTQPPRQDDSEYKALVESAMNQLAEASSMDDLKNRYLSLPEEMKRDRSVKAEAERLKAVFKDKAK
nr:ERF family protein [uncultured Porphyromonas sp.]